LFGSHNPQIKEAVMFGLRSPYDDVFNEFRRLEREFDALLDGGTALSGNRNIRSFASGTFPAVNVAANPEAVTVYLFAPGIDPKSLEISIQQNVLSVAGTRDVKGEEEGTYFRRERFTGSFRRVVALPDDVDPEKVDARYDAGIVHITIGRRASEKPRRIDIQS
jgi:HSP20 family protein